jgi:hypothetical protein
VTRHVSEEELMKLIRKLSAEEDSRQETDSPDPADAPSSKGSSKADNDGTVWIERHQIKVTNPSGAGKPATLVPAPPVVLVVNGKIVEQETAVWAEDRIEWYVDPKPLFTIQVSKDGMQATLHVHAKERFAWNLKSTSPASRLRPEAYEDKNIVMETLKFKDVMAQIEALGIKHVKFPEVYEEIHRCTMKPIVIAEGKPPTPSTDARLDFFFKENVEHFFTEVAGAVDFRNHLSIPSARKGDVLGKKIPAVMGEPGYDIYGKVLLPDPPKDFTLIAREHVHIDEQGQIIALKDGRPRITGTTVKFVDISTAYIVPGNVDLRTGNIVFSGDVIVYGDVTENMIVESLGNVYVQGNVYGATITATGSVIIKGNIVRSHLYSGHFGVIYNRLFQYARQLSNDLKSLVDNARTLIQAVTEKKQHVNPGRVILILIEKKYKDVYRAAREILSVIANIHTIHKDTLVELKEKLEWFLQPMKIIMIESLDILVSLQKQLEETYQGIESLKESQAKIEINQCYLSVLKANGDILIRRDGVLQSQLHANSNIIFYEETAVCRGSHLEAGGAISAMVVGDGASANTILKAAKKIVVKEIHQGRVCIGRYCREIFETMRNQTFDLQSLKG